MAAPKAYKRSWRNLLLNKRYQLRFTLFMVGLAALLMTGLGIWVMKEANEATTVAMARVRGEPCPSVPTITEIPQEQDNGVPMKLDGSDGSAAPAPEPAPAPAPAPSEKAPAAAPVPSADPNQVKKHNAMSDVLAVTALWCTDATCKPARAEPLDIKAVHKGTCDDYVKAKLEDAAAVAALRTAMIPVVKCDGGQSFTVADAPEPERHAVVTMDETSMTLTPTVPTDFTDRIIQHWECDMRQAGSLDSLERGRMRILWVLLATGVMLSVGLAIYGIKMTHKVAGPLFKVSLYLAKMRDGRFDKVYNLRKGDQLVDFYEHFKTAHAGVVGMERDDIEQIKAVIAAAEDAGAGGHEAIGELKKALARKEKSLE